MTAAERSELAAFRQEMNDRFDSLDERLRMNEVAVAVASALNTKENAEAAQVADRKFSNSISRRERLVGKAGVCVALVLGIANILIHFL